VFVFICLYVCSWVRGREWEWECLVCRDERCLHYYFWWFFYVCLYAEPIYLSMSINDAKILDEAWGWFYLPRKMLLEREREKWEREKGERKRAWERASRESAPESERAHEESLRVYWETRERYMPKRLQRGEMIQPSRNVLLLILLLLLLSFVLFHLVLIIFIIIFHIIIYSKESV